jgi:hypothetical protein
MSRFLFFLPILLLFSSCKKPEYGSLTVSLKDGPADFDEVNVDLQNVEVYIKDASAAGWYELKTNRGIYNLLNFQEASMILASQTRIPAGSISQIRLTFGGNNSVRANNDYYALQTRKQAGEKNTVIIPAECALSANGVLHLLIDMDADRSVVKKEKHNFFLEPVAVSGVVSSPFDLY